MIYFLTFALACSPLDIQKIKCDTICKQDGDDIGVTIKGICYCSNKRDTKKVPFKLNRDLRVDVMKKDDDYLD